MGGMCFPRSLASRTAPAGCGRSCAAGASTVAMPCGTPTLSSLSSPGFPSRWCRSILDTSTSPLPKPMPRFVILRPSRPPKPCPRCCKLRLPPSLLERRASASLESPKQRINRIRVDVVGPPLAEKPHRAELPGGNQPKNRARTTPDPRGGVPNFHRKRIHLCLSRRLSSVSASASARHVSGGSSHAPKDGLINVAVEV